MQKKQNFLRVSSGFILLLIVGAFFVSPVSAILEKGKHCPCANQVSGWSVTLDYQWAVYCSSEQLRQLGELNAALGICEISIHMIIPTEIQYVVTKDMPQEKSQIDALINQRLQIVFNGLCRKPP